MSGEENKILEVSSEEILDLSIRNNPETTTSIVKSILEGKLGEGESAVLAKSNIPVQILDVREAEELDYCDLNALLTGGYSTRELTPEEVDELVGGLGYNSEEAEVLTPGNYVFSHIPLQSLLAVQEGDDLEDGFENGFAPIHQDYPVFCLCTRGIRSATAAVHLERLGFRALNVKGGLIDLAKLLGRRIRF